MLSRVCAKTVCMQPPNNLVSYFPREPLPPATTAPRDVSPEGRGKRARCEYMLDAAYGGAAWAAAGQSVTVWLWGVTRKTPVFGPELL